MCSPDVSSLPAAIFVFCVDEDAWPFYCSLSLVIVRATVFFCCEDKENIIGSLCRAGWHLWPQQTIPIAGAEVNGEEKEAVEGTVMQ